MNFVEFVLVVALLAIAGIVTFDIINDPRSEGLDDLPRNGVHRTNMDDDSRTVR